MPLPDPEDAAKVLGGIVTFLVFVGKTWTNIQAKRGKKETAALPVTQAAPALHDKDAYDNLQEDAERLRAELREKTQEAKDLRQELHDCDHQRRTEAERNRSREASLQTRGHEFRSIARSMIFRNDEKGNPIPCDDLKERLRALDSP